MPNLSRHITFLFRTSPHGKTPPHFVLCQREVPGLFLVIERNVNAKWADNWKYGLSQDRIVKYCPSRPDVRVYIA